MCPYNYGTIPLIQIWKNNSTSRLNLFIWSSVSKMCVISALRVSVSIDSIFITVVNPGHCARIQILFLFDKLHPLFIS